MWMLDTDTCSYILREHSPDVLERLDNVARSDVAISTVVSAELRYGALRVKSKKLAATIEQWLALFEIAPWDDDAAKTYARIRTAVEAKGRPAVEAKGRPAVEAKGRPIGNLDLLIAAHALSREATLVTNNTRHFSQVPGLRLANWL